MSIARRFKYTALIAMSARVDDALSIIVSGHEVGIAGAVAGTAYQIVKCWSDRARHRPRVMVGGAIAGCQQRERLLQVKDRSG